MSSAEVIEYDESIGGIDGPIGDDEPVPEWHLEIIRERMALYEKKGFQGTPWEEVQKELLDLLFSRKLLRD